MRHLTVFQTVALFRNDKRTATCPFSASFTPTTATSATPDDWRYSLQSRASPADARQRYHIVSAPENKVITVSIADTPSKVAYTGRENSDQYVFTKRSRRPKWSEYTPAAAALPPPASFLVDPARFAGDFIEQLHVIPYIGTPGLPRRVGLSSRPRASP